MPKRVREYSDVASQTTVGTNLVTSKLRVVLNMMEKDLHAQPEIFFPSQIDSVRQHWYSSNLKAMYEYPLWGVAEPASKLVFRCLWLRSGKSYVCVRIELRDNGSVSVNWRELYNDALNESDQAINASCEPINPAALTELVRMREAMNFWELPTNEESPFGIDGERWIFEIVDNDRYHIVDRYRPYTVERDRPLVEMGAFLIFAAQIESKFS